MFYKKIQPDETTVYIKLLSNPNTELKILIEKLKFFDKYNFREIFKNLYCFDDIENSENIDSLFEELAIPLLNISNKNNNFLKLKTGEYKNIPLYCLPSDYLKYVIKNTYDEKIKEESIKILNKRLFK